MKDKEKLNCSRLHETEEKWQEDIHDPGKESEPEKKIFFWLKRRLLGQMENFVHGL